MRVHIFSNVAYIYMREHYHFHKNILRSTVCLTTVKSKPTAIVNAKPTCHGSTQRGFVKVCSQIKYQMSVLSLGY